MAVKCSKATVAASCVRGGNLRLPQFNKVNAAFAPESAGIVKETKIRYDLLFMAYSLDYRRLILSKLESGASYRALARDYNLSKTTIQKWKKDINRKLRLSKPLKIDNDKLREDVAMYPDDYQHERAVRFNCSQRAIGIALKRIGITQKKDLNSPPS